MRPALSPPHPATGRATASGGLGARRVVITDVAPVTLAPVTLATVAVCLGILGLTTGIDIGIDSRRMRAGKPVQCVGPDELGQLLDRLEEVLQEPC